jgi:hypothetical protein
VLPLLLKYENRCPNRPFYYLRDINFELYHGTRDPKNPVYEKRGKGKYALLRKP